MNIFYDHTIFQQPYGGISRYFREVITRFLNKEEVDVHLFMGLFLNRYGLENAKNRYKSYWGYPAPYVGRTGPLRQCLNRAGWFFFQTKIAYDGGKGSVYHPTYYSFSGMSRAKTVFTVYDFTHERYPHLFRTNDKTPALKRKAFERADVLICISESTKNDLSSLFTSLKCDIKTIHLGYNDLSPLVKSNIPLPDYPYFLFVGPRHEYKNFGCLLEAFALSPSLKKDFGIVCFGGTIFSEKEKKRFSELGVADRVVRFEGGDNALAALYKNALALVFPSLYEGQGIVVLEARYLKLPIIVSNYSVVESVCVPNGQLVIGMTEDDIYNGMIKFTEGGVPQDYEFDCDAYNAACHGSFEALFDKE